MKKVVVTLSIIIALLLLGSVIVSFTRIDYMVPSLHKKEIASYKNTFSVNQIPQVKPNSSCDCIEDNDNDVWKTLNSDDERVQQACTIVNEWINLTGNRSYQTINGHEEYALYTGKYIRELIFENNDIENMKSYYKKNQLVTKVDNIKFTEVFIENYTDKKGTYMNGAGIAVEYEITAVSAKDIDAISDFYDEIGKPVRIEQEFVLEPDKDSNNEFRITEVKASRKI